MLFGETTVGTGYFLFDKFRVLFSESLRCDFGCTRARGHVWFPRISSLSTIVDAPMARFTVRRGRRRSGRTVSGALHCTPETPPRGASFHPPPTFPWCASLYAGDEGGRDGRFLARFTVRRGSRREGRVFIHSRRPHGALHCTPGTEAIGTDGFWRASLYAGDPAARGRLFIRSRSHGALHCTLGTEAIGTDGFWRASLVCRRSRREGRACIHSRRSHGALHCAPETEALCSGVHRSSTAS